MDKKLAGTAIQSGWLRFLLLREKDYKANYEFREKTWKKNNEQDAKLFFFLRSSFFLFKPPLYGQSRSRPLEKSQSRKSGLLRSPEGDF